MPFYQLGTSVKVEPDAFTVDGIPTDPTTVHFNVLDPTGALVVYLDSDPEVSNPSAGVFVLSLDAAAVSMPGVWNYEAIGEGAVEETLVGDFTVLQSPTDPVAVPFAMEGPCTPWCDPQDVWRRCGLPTFEEDGTLTPIPVDMTVYAQAASWLLWMMEGRLHTGRCVKTVRPCGNVPCGFQVLSRGFVVWPWYQNGWGWNGYDWSFPGWWGGGCGCVPLDRIYLSGYPVREIIEVKIDGVPLPEYDTSGFPNWRLDGRRMLTRMASSDGTAMRWPACQRLDMEDDQPGTFSVTLAYGQDPPPMGQLAAAQLACELYKAGTDEECQLPAGTIRVTRAGVTIEKLAVLGFYRQSSNRYGKQARWQTGLELVDAYLNAANPFGLTRRPVIMAPGQRRRRFAPTLGQ